MGLFRKKQVSRFYLLRNEDLVVYVNNLGAELMSVKDAKNKTEYIWNGDPEYWGRRSPILFPFVGALNGTHRHTDLKTTVQQVEKDTVAYLVFESVRTGERVQKQIRCNTKIAGQVGKLMG